MSAGIIGVTEYRGKELFLSKMLTRELEANLPELLNGVRACGLRVSSRHY
ncbi:MAG: hypothetical protein ACTS73_01655 [Arsenophonus sp. NEOnobi-MAG3]